MEQGYGTEKHERLGNIGNVFKDKPRKIKASQALRGRIQSPNPQWKELRKSSHDKRYSGESQLQSKLEHFQYLFFFLSINMAISLLLHTWLLFYPISSAVAVIRRERYEYPAVLFQLCLHCPWLQVGHCSRSQLFISSFSCWAASLASGILLLFLWGRCK